MRVTFEEQSKIDNSEYWENYSKWWEQTEETN